MIISPLCILNLTLFVKVTIFDEMLICACRNIIALFSYDYMFNETFAMFELDVRMLTESYIPVLL